MANRARGEIELAFGGETLMVVFNLGVLAQIEDRFGVESYVEALGRVMSAQPSARALLTFLEAVLLGNDIELTSERKAALRAMSVPDLIAFAERLVNSADAVQQEDAAPEGGDSPLAGAIGGARS